MTTLRGSSIFNAIYDALARREGRKTTIATLRSLTGLTDRQIQGSIAHARRNSELHAEQIEVLEPGKAWRYRADGLTDITVTPEKITKEVEMGAPHIWKTVFNVLTQNPGVVLHKDTIAREASTDEQEITPHQVSNAMLTILRRPELSPLIEIKWAGRAWKYRAPEDRERQPAPKVEPTISVPIRSSVLRYVMMNPNKPLFADDIAEQLGFTRKQVQNAMHHYVHENEATKPQLTVLSPSHAWQYTTSEPSSAPESTPAAATNGHAPNAVESVSQAVPYTPEAAAASPVAVAVAQSSGGRLFEEITELPGSNDILIKEADSGAVYRATPLA